MEAAFKRRSLRINTITKDTKGIWEEAKILAPLPPRRCNHTAELLENKLIIYGGQDISEGVLDDLWVLNISPENTLAEKWIRLECGPNSPGPLCRHSSVLYNSKKYILGGTDLTEEKSGLYSYDLATNTWEYFPTIFKALDSHSAAVYNDMMVVFGGYDNGFLSNSLHFYNFERNSWETSSAANPPEPRADHSGVIYHNSLYIHGGILSNSDISAEVWKFDLITSVWSQIRSAENSPGPISGHTACVFKDVILIFGGVKDLLKETNEMRCFHLESETWSLIQTETESLDPVFNREEIEKAQKKAKERLTAGQRKVAATQRVQNEKRNTMVDESYEMEKKRLAKVVFQGRIRGKIPHSRDGHTCVVYEDYMVIFGGDRHRMAYNDLYFYSINENLLRNN